MGNTHVTARVLVPCLTPCRARVLLSREGPDKGQWQTGNQRPAHAHKQSVQRVLILVGLLSLSRTLAVAGAHLLTLTLSDSHTFSLSLTHPLHLSHCHFYDLSQSLSLSRYDLTGVIDKSLVHR